MSFKIEEDGRHHRIYGDKGNLIGLLSPVTAGMMTTRGPVAGERWRVEMLMKIDHALNSRDEAIAFIRGAEATMRAYKLIPKVEE